MPVQQAGPQEPREGTVCSRFAPVALPAEPAEVLQGERRPQCLRPQRPGHVDGQPVIKLGRNTAAGLAHRHLNTGLLAPGHAVGAQAVGVPCQIYAGSPSFCGTQPGAPQRMPLWSRPDPSMTRRRRKVMSPGA